MKKLILILLVLLLVSVTYSETMAESTFKVIVEIGFHANFLFSRYNVDLYLNGAKLGTLPHGKDYTATFDTAAESNTLSFFKSDNQSVNGKIDFEINGNATIKCSISCYRDRIDIRDVKIEIEEPAIKTEPEIAESPTEETAQNLNEINTIDFIDAPFLKGRGYVDIAGLEPNYINTAGYAAVYTNMKLEENPDFVNYPWTVPIYEKRGEEWEQSGVIYHKTKIGIINQELKKKNGKEFQGYLEFQSIESGETGYINVMNYVTTAYWDQDLANAAEKGYCIAVYKGRSKYPPIYQNKNKTKLSDDSMVLIPPRGTFFVSIEDKENYPVVGIAFVEKNGKKNKHYVFFNKNDLSLIY